MPYVELALRTRAFAARGSVGIERWKIRFSAGSSETSDSAGPRLPTCSVLFVDGPRCARRALSPAAVVPLLQYGVAFGLARLSYAHHRAALRSVVGVGLGRGAIAREQFPDAGLSQPQ